MSAVPVFGQAVQAPIVIGPNAEPRVSASQVAPSPAAAATAKVSKKPKSKRTVDPLKRDVEDYALAATRLNRLDRRPALRRRLPRPRRPDRRAPRDPRRPGSRQVTSRTIPTWR